jgi:phenylalanyl-tRNA synthetase beta chain
MLISANWIRELLPSIEWNTASIAERLTAAGLEVEHIVDQAARLHGFVVGHVLDKQPHPKADKLSICTVDVGRGAPVTIVCGAPNVAAGQRVPVALPGCRLPNADFTIAERPLRGVVSQGMICSQAELGLGEDADGIWVLDETFEPGMDLAAALGQTDVILDIAITPNRADALSHIGLAREIALLQDPENVHSIVATPAKYQPDASVPPVTVRIEAPELCHRFVALPVHGITLGPSPKWMQDRLRSCGLRPRNVIVDVTNYVMLELGQPLHAYDARSVDERTFVVRTAGTDAPFTTLDGTTRTMSSDMLMICDANKPLGIAGVMGGKNSEISNDTVDVIVESAYFLPSSIRTTAKRLEIQSDASYRFERGVDPTLANVAALRAAELLAELAGGVRGPVTCVEEVEYQAPTITVRFDRVRSILGANVDNATIAGLCKALHCNALSEGDGTVVLQPPSWRVDISIEIDIIEEIMRIRGLDAIPVPRNTMIPVLASPLPSNLRKSKVSRKIVQHVVNQGFYECCTVSQTSPRLVEITGSDGVHVANPLGADASMMRTSLIPGLLTVAAWNVRHGTDELRLVEEGRVFFRDATTSLGVREERRIALLICGSLPTTWYQPKRQLDYYDLAGTVESLCRYVGCGRPRFVAVSMAPALWSGNVADVNIDEAIVGRVGQVAPDVAASFGLEAPVFAAELFTDAFRPTVARYVAPSMYPSVERDIALIMPSHITVGALMQDVENIGLDILAAIHIFDVFNDERYLGAGKKSIGLRLTFVHKERTLVDHEVDTAVARIVSAVEQSCGATLRGSVA